MANYMRKGTSKIYFVPSLAAQTTPTQAELTAGSNITSLVASLSGFNFKSTLVDTPNFGTRQTPKIPGENTSDDSSMEFYEDDTSNPIRTTLAKDVSGFILMFPKNTTSTSKVDVFPVTVSSNTRTWSSGNEAAKFVVDFAITAAVTNDAIMGA